MNTTVYGGVRLTLFGHASVCLEFGGHVIYVDPYVLGPGAKPADLILHTHSHHDHCVLPKSILTSSTLILGHGCKHPGRTLEIGEKVSAAGAVIEVVHAYNPSKPYHPQGFGAGYILSFAPPASTSIGSGEPMMRQGAHSALSAGAARPPVRVYVAGDTDHIPEMKNYKCDIAFLPIGGTYTMDIAEAAKAVADIRPKIVIPYHYNYLDATKADAGAFKQAVEALAPGTDVRILTP